MNPGAAGDKEERDRLERKQALKTARNGWDSASNATRPLTLMIRNRSVPVPPALRVSEKLQPAIPLNPATLKSVLKTSLSFEPARGVTVCTYV